MNAPDFIWGTIQIALIFFTLGAVFRAYFIFPKRIHDLEKRINRLENKEKK